MAVPIYFHLNLNDVSFYKLPDTRTVLWDHSSNGTTSSLHLTLHQQPKVYIKEKVLQCASTKLQAEESGQILCKLYGSLNGGVSSRGISAVLTKYDESTGKNSTFGDISIPVMVCRRTKGNNQWNINDYFSDMKAICSACNLIRIDLTKLFKFRIKCSFFGIQCDVMMELITLSSSFIAKPIKSVPICPSALTEHLCKSNGVTACTGFVALDSAKRFVLVSEIQPQLSRLPLVGIWVGGVTSVLHPLVWAACVRYVFSTQYKERLCFPPLPFVLVLYAPGAFSPQFFDCICDSPGNTWPSFVYYEGYASTTLPKVPVMESKMLIVEFSKPAEEHEHFKNAEHQIEHRKLPAGPIVIITNADEIPLPSHREPYISEIFDAEKQVPDISVVSDEGSDYSLLEFNSIRQRMIPSQCFVGNRRVFSPENIFSIKDNLHVSQKSNVIDTAEENCVDNCCFSLTKAAGINIDGNKNAKDLPVVLEKHIYHDVSGAACTSHIVTCKQQTIHNRIYAKLSSVEQKYSDEESTQPKCQNENDIPISIVTTLQEEELPKRLPSATQAPVNTHSESRYSPSSQTVETTNIKEITVKPALSINKKSCLKKPSNFNTKSHGNPTKQSHTSQNSAIPVKTSQPSATKPSRIPVNRFVTCMPNKKYTAKTESKSKNISRKSTKPVTAIINNDTSHASSQENDDAIYKLLKSQNEVFSAVQDQLSKLLNGNNLSVDVSSSHLSSTGNNEDGAGKQSKEDGKFKGGPEVVDSSKQNVYNSDSGEVMEVVNLQKQILQKQKEQIQEIENQLALVLQADQKSALSDSQRLTVIPDKHENEHMPEDILRYKSNEHEPVGKCLPETDQATYLQKNCVSKQRCSIATMTSFTSVHNGHNSTQKAGNEPDASAIKVPKQLEGRHLHKDMKSKGNGKNSQLYADNVRHKELNRNGHIPTVSLKDLSRMNKGDPVYSPESTMLLDLPDCSVTVDNSMDHPNMTAPCFEKPPFSDYRVFDEFNKEHTECESDRPSDQTVHDLLGNVNDMLQKQGLAVNTSYVSLPPEHSGIQCTDVKRIYSAGDENQFHMNYGPLFNEHHCHQKQDIRKTKTTEQTVFSVQQSCVLTTQYCEYSVARTDFSGEFSGMTARYFSDLSTCMGQGTRAKKQPLLSRKSDMSVYGMPTSCLTFDTCQYLEKYGLFPGGELREPDLENT